MMFGSLCWFIAVSMITNEKTDLKTDHGSHDIKWIYSEHAEEDEICNQLNNIYESKNP
jgi:hypothetical protein